jgi:hypothetical protein
MDITPGNIIRYAGEFCLVLSIDYTEKTCLVINKEGVVFTRDMSVIRNNYKSVLLENLLTALKNFESEQENIVRDNQLSFLEYLDGFSFQYRNMYHIVENDVKVDGNYVYVLVRNCDTNYKDWVELQVLLNRITHGDL